MTPDTYTAGTGAIHAPAAPHRWQPIVPEPGERVRCAVCGSEDRWRHIPQPRQESK